MNSVVIDDEPLAREGIADYIKDTPFLSLVGIFASPIELIQKGQDFKYDLLFLDIEMPKLDGLSFLKAMQTPPLTVIITAYPQYALEGFELNVVDYLVKPVSRSKFLKATQKAQQLFQSTNPTSTNTSDFFFIKEDKKVKKIFLQDILFIESMQNYVKIHTEKSQHIAYLTLSEVENKLPESNFLKVHKSYIISIQKVRQIEGNSLLIGDNSVPISRDKRTEVLNRIIGNGLWQRT